MISTNATFYSAALSQGTFMQADGTVTCTIGSMAAGAVVTISLAVTPVMIGTITNAVTVTPNQTASGTFVDSAPLASAGYYRIKAGP